MRDMVLNEMVLSSGTINIIAMLCGWIYTISILGIDYAAIPKAL